MPSITTYGELDARTSGPRRRRREPMNRRTLNPSGGEATATKMGKLRAKRALLEADHAAHPTQVKAMGLAMHYRTMSEAVLEAAGLNADSLDELRALGLAEASI